MAARTKLQECEAKLWALTIKLVSSSVPFNPPMEGERLARMKKHNPKGYELLQEYLTALDEEKKLKGEL